MNEPSLELVRIGVVVIGRNEGTRLCWALDSLPRDVVATIYVDSCSTDGSVELARSKGIEVHPLDASQLLSAARARREGFEFLRKCRQGVELVQFLDGDCALHSDWLNEGAAFLVEHEDVAIVCGQLAERDSQRSVYNRFNALQWKAPAGDVESCGGVFMVRREAYEDAGGFDAALLTGEESVFCSRIRRKGWRIVRLDIPMACHDSALLTFGQWWCRAVWGGYGDAIEYRVLRRRVGQRRRKETRSGLLWGLTVPLLIVILAVGAILNPWLGLAAGMLAATYLVLFMRIFRSCVQRGDGGRDATVYAIICMLRKFPTALGFVRYWITPWTRTRLPDPHKPTLEVEFRHAATSHSNCQAHRTS